MADETLSIGGIYARERRTADREDVLRWLAQPDPAQPAPVPAPAAPAAPKPAERPGAVAAGATTFWDTFQAGAQNIADAIYAKMPPPPTGPGVLGALPRAPDAGQAVLGALQIALSPFVGGAKALTQAIVNYAPGLESSVALDSTAAKNLRVVLGAPNIIFDPKIREATGEQARAVVGEMERPMMYSELIELLAQFAVPMGVGKAGKMLKGKPTPTPAPPKALPERATPAPPGPQAGSEGMARPMPAEFPGAPPEALGPRVFEAGPGGEAPLSPAQVAIELRTILEQTPFPEKPPARQVRPFREDAPLTIQAGEAGATSGLLDAQGRPLAPAVVEAIVGRDRLRAFERTALDQPRRTTPEGAPAVPEAPAGDLGSALDVAMKKMEAVFKEQDVQRAIERGDFTGAEFGQAGVPEARAREAGKVDTGLLVRMALGAAAGSTQGDTPEERIVNAFLGMGFGAAFSKRLAVKLAEAYKTSGLASESGAIDFSKFRARPKMQPGEEAFQPNYQRLALTPELSRFSKNLHRLMKEEILSRKGKPKTHDATVIAAEGLLSDGKMTAERVLQLEGDAVLSREEITAARMIGQRARDYSWKSNEAFKAGQLTGEELIDGFVVAGAISKNVRVAQTRIAQAQEASKIRVGYDKPSNYRPEDVIHLADDLSANMTAEQLSKAMDAIQNPAHRVKALELAAVFPRAFLELMYFSQLSGKAILRNAFGNLVMPPLEIGSMALAPYMPRWGAKAQLTRVLPGSATQMTIAWGEGLLDVFRLLRVWDKETRGELAGLQERIGGGRQIESRYAPAITSENLGGGQAMDILGGTFRTPQNILGTTDAMSKMVNARIWQRFEAFHQAGKEGLTGEGMWKRVDDLVDDPTLFSDLARERIQDFAERQTLTKDFEGRMLGALQRGPENAWLNAAYRWQVMPYFRTPMRGVEQGFTRTPGLNFLTSKFYADMKAGGREQQIAQARVLFGGAILGTFGYLESQGLVTGDGPSDPKLAKQWRDELGMQPRSWWDVGSGKWRSYDGLAPVSDLIAAGADMSAAARRTSGDLGSMWLAGAVAMATSFDTKGYTRTLSDWFDFMRPGTTDDSKWELFLSLQRKRIAGVVQPGALRELESVGDPAVRRARPSGAFPEGGTGSAIARELDVLVREWKSQIPGLSATKDAEGNWLIPPDRDRIDGKITFIETYPFNPFLAKTPTTDALKIHLFGDLLGAGLAPFPEWIGGGRPVADVGIGTREAENVSAGVRMTPQEKDRYAVLMTTEIKNAVGQGYRQALEEAMRNPMYQAESGIGASGTPRDSGKARWLQRIDEEFRRLAEERLIQEVGGEASKLHKEITRKQTERSVRKMPTAEQPSIRRMLESLTR